MSFKHIAISISARSVSILALSFLLAGCSDIQEIPTQDQRTVVSSVTLNQASAEMLVGETVTLIATVLPPDATDRDKLIWSSSKTSVATVSDKGVVFYPPFSDYSAED